MTHYTIQSADDMMALGAKLSQQIQAPAMIFLQGELGAGKTTLVRGWLHALGFKGAVKSPTYTLVECYALPKFTLCHFDLYRLNDPVELEAIGIRDYFTEKAICLIEWPEHGQGVLPKADVVIKIAIKDDLREVVVDYMS